MLPFTMQGGPPYNIYPEELRPLYHGLSLWEPSPIKNLYDKVSIGDVGYIHKGFFYRMFNVTVTGLEGW